jgi:hypothetical protein
VYCLSRSFSRGGEDDEDEKGKGQEKQTARVIQSSQMSKATDQTKWLKKEEGILLSAAKKLLLFWTVCTEFEMSKKEIHITLDLVRIRLIMMPCCDWCQLSPLKVADTKASAAFMAPSLSGPDRSCFWGCAPCIYSEDILFRGSELCIHYCRYR